MEPETMRSPAAGSSGGGHLRHMQYMSPNLRRLPLSAAATHQFGAANNKPLTPRNQSPFGTPNALHHNKSRFHIFHPVNNTPPSRFPIKVHNPFEAALVDRLHLPLIGSPSLFHLPSTPQHSSTQFEWTIDEVSSLNPTNVEAHETQFISIIDPELEAKAQEAITSYFNDKISVPSPIDCPLRNQKIILSSCSTPSVRPTNTRHAHSQTELTLPPILPAELEAALRPFCTYTQDQQHSPSKRTIGANSTIDHEARDASLRRKLFNASLNSTESDDGHNFLLEMDDCLSPAPTSPEIMSAAQSKVLGESRTFQSPNAKCRSFNSSMSPVRSGSEGRCSSFGSISPITRDTQSPTRATHDQRPPHLSNHNSSSIYQSTPGSSSASSATVFLSSMESAIHMSVDMSTTQQSTSSRVHHRTNVHPIRLLSKSFGSDMSTMDDDDDDRENVGPDCDMMGAASATSPSSSRTSSSNSPDSQHSGTPSRKLRRANRKNLSLSFSSSQFLSDESMVEQEALMHHAQQPPATSIESVDKECLAQPIDQHVGGLLLSQTDSGFNEMEE